MDFCEKLQQLRTKKGLTQEQLAEKVFVSRVAVSKWESGRGYPNLDSLKNLAKVFGLTIDELLSTDEMMDIAEVQERSTSGALLSLTLGIADSMAALLFVVPMFANRFHDRIEIVALQDLTQATGHTRASLFTVACASILLGLAELALQNIQPPLKRRAEPILSGAVSSLGIMLSALTNQPYCCLFLFALFLAKVLLALRRRRGT